MQYAYITLEKNKKSLFRRTEHKAFVCGANTLHIINSSRRKSAIEKKLRRLGIDFYLSNTEIPSLRRYIPGNCYKYFAPEIFRYMYKNHPSDNLTVCSDMSGDIIYLAEKLANMRINFFITADPGGAAKAVLEKTGIPVILTRAVENCILIRFSGVCPKYGKNVSVADFENSRFFFEGIDGNIDLACMTAEYLGLSPELIADKFKLLRITGQ